MHATTCILPFTISPRKEEQGVQARARWLISLTAEQLAALTRAQRQQLSGELERVNLPIGDVERATSRRPRSGVLAAAAAANEVRRRVRGLRGSPAARNPPE